MFVRGTSIIFEWWEGGKVKYDLGVVSYGFKSTSYEFKSTS